LILKIRYWCKSIIKTDLKLLKFFKTYWTAEDSVEYRNVNSIVKIITGQNIIEHARGKKSQIANAKEGDPELPKSISVSQLDFKSKLINFRSLIALLRTYEFYQPTDGTISVKSLEQLETEVVASLVKLADKESGYMVNRSAVLNLFDNKGGLKDRAKRARMHVRRKYGISSSEYKSLVNRRY